MCVAYLFTPNGFMACCTYTNYFGILVSVSRLCYRVLYDDFDVRKICLTVTILIINIPYTVLTRTFVCISF